VQLDLQAFSLPDLVQDVFQKFELAAQARRQSLVADIPDDVPAVVGELGLVERVLTNLLDNAIRHTPEGGRIELTLRATPRSVIVTIADNGPGIPPALRAKLFDTPSVWVSGNRDSGGLGLMIVRQILQLHGTRIQLVDDDRGAVFRFELATG
jgi:signal transduction histidine kinase